MQLRDKKLDEALPHQIRNCKKKIDRDRKDKLIPNQSEKSTRFYQGETSQKFCTNRRTHVNIRILTAGDRSECAEEQMQSSIIHIHSQFNISAPRITFAHGILQHYAFFSDASHTDWEQNTTDTEHHHHQQSVSEYDVIVTRFEST